jgi:hypothetical protein
MAAQRYLSVELMLVGTLDGTLTYARISYSMCCSEAEQQSHCSVNLRFAIGHVTLSDHELIFQPPCASYCCSLHLHT